VAVHHYERGLREATGPGGLIFGLIRMRSSTFVGIRINAAMQVPDVNVIRRTVIPSTENRKVRRFDPDLGCHLD
jgi:hypothetical protein